MKNHIITLAIVLAVGLPSIALAAPKDSLKPDLDAKAVQKQTEITEKVDQIKSANSQNKSTKLKELGNMLIAKRLEAISKLKQKISSNSKISENQKNISLARLNSNEAELNQLKIKIAAETDLNLLKQEVKSVIQKFRVFSVILPQSMGDESVGRGQYILGRLEALNAKVEKVISQKKYSNDKVNQIAALQSNFDTEIADAKKQLETASTQFKTMSPNNTDTAKQARLAGREAMRLAKNSLKNAHEILKQIVAIVKTK